MTAMDPRYKSYSDWLAARRTSLSRGGLWLAGDEPGRSDPAGFDQARLRILICRLSPYDDVQASITHRVLLCAAQAVPGVYADLAFFPPEADAALMRKDGIPFWLATGSKRAPADFDVVAISLSVQQEALNLPAALQESGLRLDHAGRMAEARHPLVLLGGHGAGSVPFVHGDANGPGTGGLVDAVCLGDGVAWLQEFLRKRIAGPAAGQPKPDFLHALARELPGTYVPALYRHIVKDNRLVSIAPLQPDVPLPAEFRQDPMDIWLKGYDGAYIPFSEEETEETLPLAAGCAYRCRFCQTGWMRGEFSSATREELLATAGRFKAAMANADLNLLASDACSVTGLENILEALCPLFRRVSVKSLSVASLVRRPESFRLLRKLAKHEFTFGVEGVSARLRAYLGKPATAADLIRIAGSLADGGLRQLKLFFIVTGLEETRDLSELESLLKSIHAKVPACRIIASFMPLFHAPFTPLQFAPVRTLSPHLEQELSSAIRHAGAEFRWSAFPDEISLMNRLCRAGRLATPALVRFSNQRGLRYYHRLNPGLIRELEGDLPPDSAEATLPSVFPWSDLRAGTDVSTLWRSYQKACQELRATPEPLSTGSKPLPFRSPSSPDHSPRPVKPERVFFWAQVRPEQAGQPDHVIVRGLLRCLFAKSKKSILAYMGNPLLLRPAGLAGLGLASAEFTPGTRIPGESDGLEKADVSEIREGSIWFGVRWTSVAPAGKILETLKRDGVKYQTVRHGTSRWHVVGRAFRARTGIAALQEDERQTRLFCQRSPASLKKVFDAYPAGDNQILLAPSDSPCPACKGTAFATLKSIADDPIPACFDCLTRPGRGGFPIPPSKNG